MGLIKEGTRFAVLTDILGDEDHLGDMDFKVAGTDRGITALQMDIKIQGITKEIMGVALAQANEARMHILKIMHEAMPHERTEMSAYAPRMVTFKINPEKIRDVIGKGGAVIRALSDGVVNASCGSASTQATIASFVDNQVAGGHYNFDGASSGATAASSGLIIYRALQALTDSEVTASTVRPGATRTMWAGTGQIRDYLNTQCGAGL